MSSRKKAYAIRLGRGGALILLSEPFSANLGGTTEAVFRPIGLKTAFYFFIIIITIKERNYGVFSTVQNKNDG